MEMTKRTMSVQVMAVLRKANGGSNVSTTNGFMIFIAQAKQVNLCTELDLWELVGPGIIDTSRVSTGLKCNRKFCVEEINLIQFVFVRSL